MLVRRPDITRQQFRDHYEETHAPLALPLMKALPEGTRMIATGVVTLGTIALLFLPQSAKDFFGRP